MLEHGKPVLNVDIDIGGGKSGKITVKVGDDPFSLALDFCISFELVKSPPPFENGAHVVSNVAAFEAENRHVKTVKNHIMKFVDVETSKKTRNGGKPAGKTVVGKKGCLKMLEEYERWQKKAAAGAVTAAGVKSEVKAQAGPNVDPFSVSPRIPENKRMASAGSDMHNQQQAALQPTVKKGRYDSPVSGKERTNSNASTSNTAPVNTAPPLKVPTQVKTPVKEVKQIPTKAAKRENKAVSEPKPVTTPKPEATPTPPAKKDEEGSGMLVIGAVAAIAVGVALVFMRKK
ncbi:hypothetical protein TL16_g00302 [Triparma laevis f. inornata]|uniref:Uncharacterized protein n=1 Tax=Triparma laevis f. inornata TaxID=1714386 RepID=A0A9W6ZDM9_9STRA|nr:hypothetical protein TL16_g00302 [Triparma laevis f. inornata]